MGSQHLVDDTIDRHKMTRNEPYTLRNDHRHRLNIFTVHNRLGMLDKSLGHSRLEGSSLRLRIRLAGRDLHLCRPDFAEAGPLGLDRCDPPGFPVSHQKVVLAEPSCAADETTAL